MIKESTSFLGLIILLILVSIIEPVTCLRFGFLSTDPNDVKFYIYTNASNADAHNEIIYGNNKSIISCGYDPTKPLILLVHGVLSNYKTLTDVQSVKNAYLEAETDSNIMMVDYGKLAESRLPRVLSPFAYLLAIGGVLNTNIVGTRIADFIKFLMDADSALQGPEHVHLVGFGVGGHISGVAGRLIQERSGKLVGRITALDPPPQYQIRRLTLTHANANFVDITYTSLGRFGAALNVVGLKQGHVQFYINGGDIQPNCPNWTPFLDPFCSHISAAYYYAKSIKTKEIRACRCTRCRGNWVQRVTRLRISQGEQCLEKVSYGEYVSTRARGNYQVILP